MSSTDGEGGLTLGLRVQGTSPAQIDQLTGELQRFLQARTEDVTFQRRKEDPESQSAGALLLAVLATPAVVQLAKGSSAALKELAAGIADFMRKRNVSVEFSADGAAKVEGRPEQVERIVHDLLLAQLNARKAP